MMTTTNSFSTADILGDAGQSLFEHKCATIPRERLHRPGPDFVDRIWSASDRIRVSCGPCRCFSIMVA